MTHLLLCRPMVVFVLFAERWLLSAVFLFLAYEYLDTLRLMRLVSQCQNLMPQEFIARDAGLRDGCNFADYARYGLLAGSNFLSGVLLLTSRKPRRQPNHCNEVVIPLAATFSYMIFNQRVPYPAWMTLPMVPVAWEAPLAALGVGLCFAGSAFSLGAMFWLGRSLGIVISVRKVVFGGPYRFVRHPIYLGYFFILAGLLLTACTCRMLCLTLGASGLLVWRARLEERALCEYSAAYRERMSLTGAFWPKGGWRTVTARLPSMRPFATGSAARRSELPVLAEESSPLEAR